MFSMEIIEAVHRMVDDALDEETLATWTIENIGEMASEPQAEEVW